MARPPTGRPWARVLFQVKGGPEWAAWLGRFKRHAGYEDVAPLVEAAIVDFARRKKFPEKPPARLGRE